MAESARVMAKLSQNILDEGREFIYKKDVDGLIHWINRNHILVSIAPIRRSFELLFDVGADDKAIRLFDNTFGDIDPDADAKKIMINMGIVGSIVLFMLGGIVLFVKSLFK